MANWARSAPSGSTNRRRWNLEDRASLNRLKEHIAEAGCPEVQYDLAKELLDTTSIKLCDPNYTQAVHWLINAAQQGHEEAAKLLRKCHTNGIGITLENEEEVRCCLSMTPGERAARKAARELFACLSNGSEHITPRQLERRMRQIYNMQRKRRRKGDNNNHDDATESESENEPLQDAMALGRIRLEPRPNDLQRYNITEANLISAASNYTAGRMPAVSDALSLSAPHPDTLDHVPCFHRILFHPIIFFTLLYHRFLNFAVSLPNALPIGTRLLGLLFIVYLASGEKSTNVLPIFSFYFSLAVMLLSTCKMLKTQQDFVDFRIWSVLFLRYGDNIEADLSENRFLRNNIKPYLYFFCAFICNLIVYPLVANEWIPNSELTIISGTFVFVSMVAFMYGSSCHFPDWTIIISFAVNVLAKYPYEMDEVVSNRWRFLDLRVPTFPSFVIGNGIEFCLNCRTALYLMIPILLVLLAKRSHWRGVYVSLIPHCVTLSWLQICILTSQSATIFGVIRATLGLAGIILFLPLFGIVSLLIPVFVAIDWMGFTDAHVRWSSAVIACISAIFLSCCMAVNRVTQKYVTICQILIGLLATSVLVYPYMTSNFKDSPRFSTFSSMNNINKTALNNIGHHDSVMELTWDRYYELCARPISEKSNKIETQMLCSHLNGLHISWKGIVNQVQINQYSNIRDELITKYLPEWVANILRCLYGDPVTEEFSCDEQSDKLCEDWLRLSRTIQKQSGRCSLQRWNRYEYEILVKVAKSDSESGKPMDILLQASHEFGNFTHRLHNGDAIHFYGRLHNAGQLINKERKIHMIAINSGATTATINPPQIYLKTIECLYCKDLSLSSMSIERPSTKSSLNARMQDLNRGIKYLLNALLNPLIIFK